MVAALPCPDIAVSGPYTWALVWDTKREPSGRASRLGASGVSARKRRSKGFEIYGPLEARDQAMIINSEESVWA